MFGFLSSKLIGTAQEEAPPAKESRSRERRSRGKDSSHDSRHNSRHDSQHDSRLDSQRTTDVDFEGERGQGFSTTLPPELLADQEWACQACTFLNAPHLTKCEVCGADRPVGVGSPTSPDFSASSAAPPPAFSTDHHLSREISPGGSSGGSTPQPTSMLQQKKDTSQQRRSRRRPGAGSGGMNSPVESDLPDSDVQQRMYENRMHDGLPPKVPSRQLDHGSRPYEQPPSRSYDQQPVSRQFSQPSQDQRRMSRDYDQGGFGGMSRPYDSRQSVDSYSRETSKDAGGRMRGDDRFRGHPSDDRIRGHPSEDDLTPSPNHAASSSSRPREVHWPTSRGQEAARSYSQDSDPLGRTQTSSQGRQQQRDRQQQQYQQERRPSQQLSGSGQGRLRLRILRAFNLRNTDIGILPEDVSDPFVVATLGRQEFKTEVVDNDLNPVWNSQAFEFSVDRDDAVLKLEVFNSNQWHAHDSLGRMKVPVQGLTPGETHTLVERLDEGDADRRDGLSAKLEIEVQFMVGDQPLGAGPLSLGVAAGGGQLARYQSAAQSKAPTNWVPLPSFHGFGPEAFQAPPMKIDDAPTGRDRRIEEYQSMAARLGQYDYSSDPAYFPKQEQVDKRSWKEDPFYGWRRDGGGAIDRGDMRDMGGGGGSRNRRSVLAERNNQHANEQLWHKDPFHGWLKVEDKEDGGGEQGLERIQEARVARELLALPSFHEAEVKRFDDHREYSNHHKIEVRERWGAQERAAAPEQRWRDDAFFGWLPGRGPEGPSQCTLHRPLEQARLNRLPSFSEDPALRGITGKGVGILRVWVNSATDLAYTEGSKMRGKPSACVRVKIGRGKEQVTHTVSTSHNPVWNAPPMMFEVESTGDTLHLEVADLATSHGGESHMHQYFLGSLEREVNQILQYEQRQQERGPVRLVEELAGTQRRAQLNFEVLYEPYDTEMPGSAPTSWRAGHSRHSDRGDRGDHRDRGTASLEAAYKVNRSYSAASFRSSGSSVDYHSQGLGMLSVRVIGAYNLVNTDTGILGDVSDPYVTLRLGSQQEKQRKRTNTIDNNLNPVWNSSPFLFPVHKDDDTLHLEVYDEDTFSSDDFLGRLIVPLYRIICGQPNRAVRIRDRLQDIDHGELEVEIGFSPG